MSSHIPDLADPWRLVQCHSCFEGVVPATIFPRLVEAVQELPGDLEYRLRFGQDVEGRACIEGYVRLAVAMVCQRCLERVVLNLDSAFQLVLVATEDEADRLPDELDVVALPERPMRILDLLEDEVLLSLPVVPIHPPGECGIQLSGAVAAPDETQTDNENPFAVLAALRKDQNKT